jgi:hypothetical protein
MRDRSANIPVGNEAGEGCASSETCASGNGQYIFDVVITGGRMHQPAARSGVTAEASPLGGPRWRGPFGG